MPPDVLVLASCQDIDSPDAARCISFGIMPLYFLDGINNRFSRVVFVEMEF